MSFLQKSWNKELEKFDLKSYKKLLKLRKEYAKRYELFAENWSKEFQKEIGEKERAFLLGKIRKLHDQEQLIERNSP
jgi:hypothetical protein